MVFLRTLEQFRVPAVVQRRAKDLLEKLEALQGDSIRETPPSFEEPAEEKPAEAETKPKVKEAQPKVEAKAKEEPQPKEKGAKGKDSAKAKDTAKAKDSAKAKTAISVKSKAVGAPPKAEEKAPQVEEKAAPREKAAPAVTSPLHKRDSSSIFSRVKELEELDRAAKKEQEAYERFKHGPVKTAEKEAVEEPDAAEEPKAKLREKDELKPQDSTERRLSAGSRELDSGGGEEEGEGEQKEDKAVKKKRFGFLKKSKAKSREKSPAPQAESMEEESTEAAQPAEEEGGKELEEGVSCGLPDHLERRVKRFGGHGWAKMAASLDATTLVLVGEKAKEERMELVGCTVGAMDIPNCNAFEMVNHPEHKQFVFRTETPEGRDLWVKAIQEAIQECAASAEPTETQEAAGELLTPACRK